MTCIHFILIVIHIFFNLSFCLHFFLPRNEPMLCMLEAKNFFARIYEVKKENQKHRQAGRQRKKEEK